VVAYTYGTLILRRHSTATVSKWNCVKTMQPT